MLSIGFHANCSFFLPALPYISHCTLIYWSHTKDLMHFRLFCPRMIELHKLSQHTHTFVRRKKTPLHFRDFEAIVTLFRERIIPVESSISCSHAFPIPIFLPQLHLIFTLPGLQINDVVSIVVVLSCCLVKVSKYTKFFYRDGDRFRKKNQQLVRWHGRLHSTPTLLRSRFHAISCNWYVPIQSPALAAKKQCFQQPFMKTEDFSNVARAFTPWMQFWRDFLEKLLHRTNFQPLRALTWFLRAL